MSDRDIQNPIEPDPQPDRSGCPWRSIARILLACYVGALAALAYWGSTDASRWDSLVWVPEDSLWVVNFAAEVGSNIAKELVVFLGLGFLAGAACGPRHEDASWLKVAFSALFASVISISVAYPFRMFVHGSPPLIPTFAASTFMVCVCVWGSWLGATWIANRSTIAWGIKQAFLFGMITCGSCAALAWAAFSAEPMEIVSTEMSTNDRRRLVQLFRDHDPRDLDMDETTEVTVTEHDLNQLASWALSLLPSGQHARIGLAEDNVSIQASFQLPPNPVLRLYLNVSTAGRLMTRDGELGFAPRSFAVGQLQVPDWLLGLGGPMIIGREWRTEATEPFFQSLKSVEVTEGIATVSYGHLDIEKGLVREALVELGVLENLEPAIQAQLNQLITLADQNPRLTFGQCIETAFAEAGRRSEAGEAIRENRAAILALGYVLGHSKLKTFLGADMPEPSRAAWKKFGGVSLRSRGDWRQHYTVSAALQVIANTLVSMDVGVLKEELDADGGSGFSFGDLLADRAGTMLAVKATESNASARALQNRIANGFREADFIPAGSDLPEGLSDREFKAQYGGLGGEGYERLLTEIDRRIAACAGYQ